MIEKALSGDRRYWSWIGILLVFMVIGLLFWIRQFNTGLTITGMSRDVPWGYYIAQLTFMVGIAASAVMVVLPYYLHNYKAFGKITVLGEFIAIASVFVCVLHVLVDLGQPYRLMNMFLHPNPNSILFWDTVVLGGYLLLNILISRVVFSAERKGIAPPKWIKPIIILSVPWAISIHTVTAFLYSGLGSRPFWMTAILAPRFLASAFAAGPALLILILLLLRKISSFKVEKEAIQKLAIIATYAMAANVFFILMEIFTAVYSGLPEHVAHFKFLYLGLNGVNTLVPWMWASSILSVVALFVLFNPKLRHKENVLAFACISLFIALWIDKGLGLIITGFTPTVLGDVFPYWPTLPEFMISVAIYCFGAMVVTVLYKVALTERALNPDK